MKSLIGRILFVSVLFACFGTGEAAEAIKLTSKDFAPHYDKYDENDPFVKNYGKYIQMRDWKLKHLSLYATADFVIKDPGWYEVWFFRTGGSGMPQIKLDGDILFGGVAGQTRGTGAFKHFTMYLESGRHTIRLQSGGKFQWVEFRPTSEPELKESLLFSTGEETVFRKGDIIDFHVFGSSDKSQGKITLEIRHTGVYKDHRLIFEKQISFSKEKKNFCQEIPYQSDTEGIFEAFLATHDGLIISPGYQFCVVDTTPSPKVKYEDEKRMHLRLVDEIDCADTNDPHFYRGDDQCRVVESAGGKYRESGSGSKNEFSKDDTEDKNKHSTMHKGWFGYRYGISKIGQPHIVEVDYPNDAMRAFYIILGEPVQIIYLVGSTFSTGYPLSGKIQTERFLLWPRTISPDIHFLNMLKDSKAAVSKIKIYAVDGGLPVMGEPSQGFSDRKAGLFAMEGDKYQPGFGGLCRSAEDLYVRGQRARYSPNMQSTFESAQHYGEYARYMGINTITVGRGDSDELLKILFLTCEKYNIDCVIWLEGFSLAPTPMDKEFAQLDPKPHFQVSRSGHTNGSKDRQNNSYPGYDPLHPAREMALKQTITDYVSKYQSYPSLKGFVFYASSRQAMSANEDFMYRSIHWGYSDYDIGLFEKDTGIKVPVSMDDPKKYEKRFDWLMANKKEEWITWRCRKIEELLNRVTAHLRALRPDMKLHLTIFSSLDFVFHSWAKNEYDHLAEEPGAVKRLLRERGIDIDCLSKNPHLVIALREDIPAEPDVESQSKISLSYGKLEYFHAGHGISEINYKKNRGLYAMRQLYPEKEGYALPITASGDSRYSDNRFIASIVEKMANGNITYLEIGNDNMLLPRIENELRDFIRKYRSLPDKGFTPYRDNDLLEPAAMWSGTHKGHTYFYLANQAANPVAIKIKWKAGRGELADASSDKIIIAASEGAAEVSIPLAQYGFEVFRHPSNWELIDVQRELPEGKTAAVQRCLNEIEEILDIVQKEEGDSKSLQCAGRFLSMARDKFSKGAVWSAAEFCNALAFEEIYNKYGYPEGVTDPSRKDLIEGDKLKELLADKSGVTLTPWSKVMPERTSDTGGVLLTSGEELFFEFDTKAAQRYLLEIKYASGDGFGPIKVLLNDQNVETIGNLPSSNVVPRTQSSHQPLPFRKGKNVLKFNRTAGNKIGIAALSMRPVYTQIRDWYIIGLFDNPNSDGKMGFPGALFYRDGELPPEKEINFTAEYDGWKGMKTSWKKLHIDDVLVDLGNYFGLEIKELTFKPSSGPKVVAYAFTYIYSPVEQEVEFKVDRLDWQIKAFMNKELIHTQLDGFGTRFFKATLKKGWNEFLLKPVTGSNLWTFNISIANPGDVKCCLEKE